MWGHKKNEQRKSLFDPDDCIDRAAKYSWWDWEDGYRPFFCRWSVDFHTQIRDEIPLWYRGTAPRDFLPQKKEKDPEVRRSMGAKIIKVFERHYFIYGMFLSLMSFVRFPKETQIFIWSIMELHRA
jgi:hypothetical protein